MLEVRKSTFSKSYENTFFRDFSCRLYNLFKEKNLSGLLIGSPVCEVDGRLQIDALLITSNVVCIIDFKNFQGKIMLPDVGDFEYGLWQTESEEQIKGGNSKNPFIQLKTQRKRFYDVTQKAIIRNLSSKDTFDPARVIRVVCFQGEIELQGTIPGSESNTFFIFDKSNFVEGIYDLIDVIDNKVNLSEDSFIAFKQVFRADLYKIDEKTTEDKIKEVSSKSARLDYTSLRDDQKAALIEIESFLEDQENHVFILQGTINSGKTFLIPYIQEVAFLSSIHETEIFAASSRVAKNLISSGSLENVNSIYSFIYGGHKTEVGLDDDKNNDDLNAKEENEIVDDLPLEVVPLKRCDNSDNVLFIVDESQLVSDSYHQSIDLVFGSGFLLRDFLAFTDLKSSRRKIVFMGDPYQLQLGKPEESPLNPQYLAKIYQLKVKCFQLLDKEEFSDINKQALSCAVSIKNNIYNSLRFYESNQVKLLNIEESLPNVSKIIQSNPDSHILTFSNEEAQKINLWIKKSVVNSGDDIAGNDLVLFNNNIAVEDVNDPFAEPKKIYNGQFAYVKQVAKEPYLVETKKVKGELINLTFRELTILIKETGYLVNILSLENYRLSSKADISNNELILFKVLLNTEVSKARSQNPFHLSYEYESINEDNTFKKYGGENNEFISQLIKGTSRRKELNEEESYLKSLIKNAKRNYRKRIENELRKDPASRFYKLKNSALLRFGWAMTVHKAMSYKWNEVIFNVDPGESVGKTNENHFRWLYTGISRATSIINLINYKTISPFTSTEFRDNNTGTKQKNIIFNTEDSDPNTRIEEFKSFLESKIQDSEFSISKVEHLNWQERYFLRSNVNADVIFGFSYNSKGEFRPPSILSGESNAARRLNEIIRSRIIRETFDNLSDKWRQHEYLRLKDSLVQFDIHFELIIQTKYKDKIRFFSKENELHLELDYDAVGHINFITAKYYDNPSIWYNLKKAIDEIRT